MSAQEENFNFYSVKIIEENKIEKKIKRRNQNTRLNRNGIKFKVISIYNISLIDCVPLLKGIKIDILF